MTWEDLRPHFEETYLNLLKTLYKDVGDIDLMTGVLLEKHKKNCFGKIGRCIVAEQFHRLKYGDRFFFTHTSQPHTFTAG